MQLWLEENTSQASDAPHHSTSFPHQLWVCSLAHFPLGGARRCTVRQGTTEGTSEAAVLKLRPKPTMYTPQALKPTVHATQVHSHPPMQPTNKPSTTL